MTPDGEIKKDILVRMRRYALKEAKEMNAQNDLQSPIFLIKEQDDYTNATGIGITTLRSNLWKTYVYALRGRLP